MATEDFDIDNYVFDEFGTEDENTNKVHQPKPEKDDRKPVNKLEDTFYQKYQLENDERSKVEKRVRLALPDSYIAAFKVGEMDLPTGQELYHTSISEAKPRDTLVERLKRQLSTKIKRSTPKFVSEKMEAMGRWRNGEEVIDPSIVASSEQEARIASVISEIFYRQQEIEEHRLNEEKAEKLIETGVQEKQQSLLLGYTEIIAKGTERVVGYQDSILTKFHQKSLELQFRHYFVAKDLLKITSDHNVKLEDAIAKVVKNTALPEAVKIEKSEMIGQIIKGRMIRSVLDDITNATNQYRTKAIEKIREKLGVFSQRSNLLRVNESEENELSITDTVKKSFSDFLTKGQSNGRIDPYSIIDLDQKTSFDNLTKRTITEVIPTYLSQIAHWTKATATGQIDPEVSTYSLQRGKLISSGTRKQDVKRTVLSEKEAAYSKKELDSFVNSFIGEDADEDIKRAVSRQILSDIVKKKGFDSERYMTMEGFSSSGLDEKSQEKVSELFRRKLTEGETPEDNKSSLAEFRDRFNYLEQTVAEPEKKIRKIGDTLGYEPLREIGLVRRHGREERIDYEMLVDMMLDERNSDSDYVSGFEKEKDENRFNSGFKRTFKRILEKDFDDIGEEIEDEEPVLKRKDRELSGLSESSILHSIDSRLSKHSDYFESILDYLYGRPMSNRKDTVPGRQGSIARPLQQLKKQEEPISRDRKIYKVSTAGVSLPETIKTKTLPKIADLGTYPKKLGGKSKDYIEGEFSRIEERVPERHKLESPIKRLYSEKTKPPYAEFSEAVDRFNVAIRLITENSKTLPVRAESKKQGMKERALSLKKGLVSKVSGIGSWMNPIENFNRVKNGIGEIFDSKKEKVLQEKDKRLAQVLALITENQKSLKDKLEGTKKKVFGDSDGDGVRDGAWWTRKRKGNTTTQTKEKEKEKKSGIFGLLSAALPLVVSGLTFIGSKIAGLAQAMGLAKMAGGLLGGGGDLIDGAKGRKKGLLRRGAGLLGRGLWGATKMAVGAVGRVAGFALFKAVPALATAVASVASAPVLLGAAAAAGVGYVGYKIYKHYTTDSGPIFRLRMNQYGFAPGDKSLIAKIAKLEELHWKHLTFLGGKVTVNSRGIDFNEMVELFDIDVEDTSDSAKERFQTWLHWYKERFSPVFKTHAAAIKSLGEGFKLESFESEIKPDKALEIIEQVKMTDYSAAFNDMTSPFEDDSLTQDSEDVKIAVEEAIKHYKEKAGSDKKEPADVFEKTTRGIEAATAASPLQKAAVASNGSSDVASTGPGKIGVFKGAALLATGMVLAPAIVAGRVMGLFDKEYGKLTAGQVVRLKSYGLTTLESGKVNLLLSMEERAIKDIKFDGQRRGIWAGVDDDYLDRYGSRFGASTPDDKARWIRWFSGRFLPVLVQYATSVKTRVNVPFQEAESRIRGNTLKTILGEVIGATAFVDGTNMPIWHVTDSPWPDYALNTDRSSAEKTVEAIEAVNDVHGDILGEDKKVKPKGVEDVDTKKEDEKGFLTKFSEKLSTAASNAYHSAKDSIGGAFSAVSNAASNAVNAVSNAVSSVIPSSSGAMGKVGNPSENRDAVIKAMLEAGITDPKEQASFMAQLDHESGGFKVLRENLNYRASRLKEVFSRYRNNPAAAERDAGNPEAIANMVYGNRSDLGNTEPGDGWKYRGRGFIQLTGRDNFTRASRDLGIDLVNNPDLAETPEVAAKLAIWYWKKSNAGAAARAGDLRASRRAVNGGYNGMADVQGKFNTYLSQALAGKFAPSGEKPARTDGETAVAATEGATPAQTTGSETNASSTPAVPVATGLTTPSTPVAQAVPTAPVVSTEAPTAPVTTPVALTPPPVVKAKVADVQSSNVDKITDQQLSAMSSILEKQLSIQSSIDGRLAQVVELLKAKGSPSQQPNTVQSPSSRIASNQPTPMQRPSVSVSRNA